MKIRKAEDRDCSDLARAALLIIEDMELPLLKKIGPGKLYHLLEKAIGEKEYRYSYQRALVAEEEGVILGACFGYDSAEEASIDEVFQELLYKQYDLKNKLFSDSEVYGEEWYLDTLVVFPEFQGKKIASKLLDALFKLLVSEKVQIVGLNVEEENLRAKKLYQSFGFQEVAKKKLGCHLYLHMQKKLA